MGGQDSDKYLLDDSNSNDVITLASHVTNSQKEVVVVSLGSLKTFLQTDLLKAETLKSAPVYFLWLAALTTLIMISQVGNIKAYNVLYHLEHAHHQDLELDMWNRITTANEFWGWADKVAEHLWLRDVHPMNFPLGYFLLRQFRVAPQEYNIPQVITMNESLKLPKTTYPEWSDGSPSTATFGPRTLPFIPDSQKTSRVNVLSVATKFNVYNTEYAFSAPLAYSTPLPEIKNQLAGLKNDSWIDASTRIIVVDILTYNPAIGSFAANHLFVEIFASGSSVPSTKAYPFNIISFSSSLRRFTFAMDIAVILGGFVILVNIFATVKTNWGLGIPVISIWEIFDLLLLIFLGIGYGFRMSLWLEVPELAHSTSDESNKEMYQILFQYGYNFERSNTYLACSVTMAWVRSLKILQYSERLGVLSLTIKFAAGELFSLAIIFIFVLAGYSVGATALFGADFEQFSSVQNSVGYLTRMLISAEIGSDWTTLQSIHPRFVWPFMGSFMLLSWLLLLNMVLAIVSGSFASVQAACGGKVADWSFGSLKDDLLLLNKSMPWSRNKNHNKKQKGRRKKTIRIIIAEIKCHSEGKLYDMKLEEWTHLVREQYSHTEARRIFERAEKDPRTMVENKQILDNSTVDDEIKSLSDTHISQVSLGNVKSEELLEINEQLQYIRSLLEIGRLSNPRATATPVTTTPPVFNNDNDSREGGVPVSRKSPSHKPMQNPIQPPQRTSASVISPSSNNTSNYNSYHVPSRRNSNVNSANNSSLLMSALDERPTVVVSVNNRRRKR